ncbi:MULTISPECIES: sulfate/molybdate ABC transporter ATP-binding protein [unclassified Rhizobium]|uniref:sulfate/molybdate ABC transporter ATP-binding protein n=1 Tax=unclassified Rhizobium TaxID=2613769 RepID=UPI001AE7AEFF|nr:MULTISPECIES: sulfate/molybdate ABC transporter ATP-binding protein [unclassified Rhizobium]MBP2460333.1 sulfate transport system ATP-binding protein [Rhizobium sp. PvP014]MBP2527730.1 sulfate transport system ATP-binding protein [Rhizobium sp. PvP099]
MEVSINNIRKEFDRFAALNDVSLKIASGELIALLGPSGSGKTTLLRLIAGLDFPTEGQIFFGAEDASHHSVQDRNVGFVFQHYALFRHMTVAENIGFGLKVRPSASRPSKTEIRKRVSDLLDMVQLSGLESRYPNQLSGGQRQRVALARAMAIEPRILLLDEPFGALDAKVRKELRRWLREFHDRTGHTTVFVTHDQEEALELADRVVVMSQGKIEQVGSADDVYDRPGSPFVFSFIGESSHLPVEVKDGTVLFQGEPIGVSGEANSSGDLYFRPEDVELTQERDALFGKVTASRRLAGTRIAEIDISNPGGSNDHEPFHVEIEVPLHAPIELGSEARFRPTRWKIFGR